MGCGVGTEEAGGGAVVSTRPLARMDWKQRMRVRAHPWTNIIYQSNRSSSPSKNSQRNSSMSLDTTDSDDT